MHAEGWYVDPYKLHEARWLSDGTATALVRDGQDESDDPPPAHPWDGPLQEIDVPEPANGDDLLRADEPEPVDLVQAVLDVFPAAGQY